MFKGSIVALITPFKDGNLDEDSYISIIQYHLNDIYENQKLLFEKS